MRVTSARRWLVAVAGAALLGSLGCVDEKTVFRNRPDFESPPAAAQGFLGYDDRDERLTVCGNCHVQHQELWEETHHADAWTTLASSGGMQNFCRDCHSVNSRGNDVEGQTGGFTATQNERYHDVQCESCHGPGLAHVTRPEATQPLASLKVGRLDPDNEQEAFGCGECHNGTHHPFVEEWQNSPHGLMAHSRTPRARAECQSCHTGQGALQAFGVQANYKEKGFAGADTLPIVCGVCHDPHSTRASRTGLAVDQTGGQLRFPVGSPDLDLNLCAKCHNRRSVPDMASATSGPHAPEAPTLVGEAGWWPPGLTNPNGTGPIIMSHGTPQANPGLCGTCHVLRFDVTDAATGQFLVRSVGHTFEALPCLDAQGAPIPGPCDRSAQTFKGCTGQAGMSCHTEATARTLLDNVAKPRINNLLTTLQALIQRVPCTEFSNTDGRFTLGEGARFNYLLAAAPGTSTDPANCTGRRVVPPVARDGQVVHNVFLLEALLTASIQEVRRAYSLPLAQEIDLRNILNMQKGQTEQ